MASESELTPEKMNAPAKSGDIWFLMSAQQKINGYLMEALLRIHTSDKEAAGAAIERVLSEVELLNRRMDNMLYRGGALNDE